MVVRRLDMVPVECVARGYLAGSGVTDLQATGTLGRAGAAARPARGQPAARADLHARDQGGGGRARRERLLRRGGRAGAAADEAAELRRLTLAVYARGHELAAERGIMLADTKFEFGRDADGRLVLGDEVLTPDSSRFWPADAVGARRPAAVLRQAVRPRLADLAGLRLVPHQRRGAAAAAGRRRRAHPRPLRRGVRAARPAALRLSSREPAAAGPPAYGGCSCRPS